MTAARVAYLPDVTAYARHSYQDGLPFFVRNFGTFGLTLNWEVFDFGKRRAAVRESEAQVAQAEENLRRVKDEVAVGIEKSFNKVQRSKNLVQVASEIVKLRQEGERLAGNQLVHGAALASDKRQASAETYKAEADFLQANLGYLLAWAELEQTVGRRPGILKPRRGLRHLNVGRPFLAAAGFQPALRSAGAPVLNCRVIQAGLQPAGPAGKRVRGQEWRPTGDHTSNSAHSRQWSDAPVARRVSRSTSTARTCSASGAVARI